MSHQLVRFDTNALNRALVGFDTLFNDFETRFSNQLNNNYPPYNIIKYDTDSYEIQLAVSGFDQDEITVEIDQNQLVIRGQKKSDDTEVQYLYKGLAARDFTRIFALAEHMEVGDGTIKNGVLKIELKRIIPDALKPRVLTLKAG
jgi:molecular chaperone IbpA